MEVFISIDPGLEDTGWAVIEADSKKMLLRDFGLIKTQSGHPLSRRLNIIYESVCDKIKKYSATRGAVEEMFFVNKIKTQAFSLYAKGAVLLAFERNGVSCDEYNPLTVKKLICGNGIADKRYVENIIRNMFSIKEKLYPDVSDAIAIGVASVRLFFLKEKNIL